MGGRGREGKGGERGESGGKNKIKKIGRKISNDGLKINT